MSLRVLLADESASIRKVFQMGLQDFGAEVKSVHNGLDVIEVAQNFAPDIIFADILLQKKNGYEVSIEIQKHNELSHVPVVLMWSSFMELDQQQYQASGAKGELEKPFDVENMRKLIRSLVQNTQSQMISDFLQFPDSMTQSFVDEEKQKAANPQVSPAMEGEAVFSADTSNSNEFSIELDGGPENESPELVEENSVFNAQTDEEFSMYEATPGSPPPMPEITKPGVDTQQATAPSPTFNDEEQWQAKPLQQHSIGQETSTETDDNLDKFESMDLGNEKKLDLNEFLYKPETSTKPVQDEKSEEYKIQNVVIPHYEDTNMSATPQEVVMSVEEKEAIIRSEVRTYLLGTIRDQLPSIVEKIVKSELENILQQELAIKNSSPQT